MKELILAEDEEQNVAPKSYFDPELLVISFYMDSAILIFSLSIFIYVLFALRFKVDSSAIIISLFYLLTMAMRIFRYLFEP